MLLKPREGKTLVRIGEIAYKNGQAAKALEALQQAQTILHKEDRFEFLPAGVGCLSHLESGNKRRSAARLDQK